jgi:hypothetical protein
MSYIPDHWWTVKLLPEDVAWIERNGERRNNNGKYLGWATKATTEGASDHIMGLAGEFAVSLVTGVSIKQIIGKTKKELNEGDLGSMIEVKTRKESDERRWDLAVNHDQLKSERVYFLCLAYQWPKNILVVGWEWGRTIESEGIKYTHRVSGHPFFVLSYKKLKKVSSIFDVLKGGK